jgi:hypothetical protein
VQAGFIHNADQFVNNLKAVLRFKILILQTSDSGIIPVRGLVLMPDTCLSGY